MLCLSKTSQKTSFVLLRLIKKSENLERGQWQPPSPLQNYYQKGQKGDLKAWKMWRKQENYFISAHSKARCLPRNSIVRSLYSCRRSIHVAVICENF